MGGGLSVFSQGETVAHFGLGACAEDVALTVRWPGGAVQEETIRSTQLDAYDGPIVIVEGEL